MPAWRGEFGHEVALVVPFAYKLNSCGMLHSTTSCGNMSAFYWFSPSHTNSRSCGRASMSHPHYRCSKQGRISWKSVLKGSPDGWWQAPPHSEHYARLPRLASSRNFSGATKQLAIINKYEPEWRDVPVNFLPLDVVQQISTAFRKACGPDARILYINDDSGGLRQGIAKDIQDKKPIIGGLRGADGQLDLDFFRGQDNAEVIQDIYASYPFLSANEIKLRLLARTRCFVTVQGGAGYFGLLFGGRSIVFQRQGRETMSFYNFMASKFAGQTVHVVGDKLRLLDELRIMLYDVNSNSPCATA
eukprot:gnl/TRDRNA2_/TRDRNA2_177226_c0_seq1.p1 gnl/TRDRNA2_/TRDRNA2_177226_c0~~gnl/TRDRNA2_/TRDRNA2_177226_c0_seq1.p1  ORF type:complete len:302 (-),score=6.18 gnl/TRDRNA2_/TRDRNA2_177226_c0_seq1:77-982(-)